MNFAALQHSVFLQALGGAILNSLWQGFILWMIYETIIVFYKSASSAFKNKLSTILIFFAFGWFVSGLISGFFIDKMFSSSADSSLPLLTATPSAYNNFNVESVISYATGILPYLSVSYIFLLFFLMAKLFSSYRYVYFIANKRLVSPPFELQYFADKVAKQIRITRKIKVWLSHHIDVPATIGFLKPVILIPVASINNLSNDQLEAIILHELSHIKRNDYITNLLISIIETILFFNPFILLLSKVIKRERENCCDDFVIHYRYDPHSYASALLSLEQTRRSNLQFAMAAVSGKKQLLTRIKRITNNNVVSKQFNYGQRLIALILVTGIIFSIAWLSPQEKNKNIKVYPVGEKEQLVTKTILNDQKKVTENITLTYDPVEQKIEREMHNEPKASTSITTKLNSGQANDRVIDNENPEWEKGDLQDINNMKFYVDDNNFKSQDVFFDQSILQLIPLQFLQDLSLKNVNIHINTDELNKNLKEAYKGINALDWKKIENEISASLLKIKADKISEKELLELCYERVKSLGKMRRVPKAMFIPQAPPATARFRKAFIIRDSLRQVETRSAGNNSPKAERWAIESNHDFPGATGENTYNYNYYYEPSVVSTSDFHDLQKKGNRRTMSDPYIRDKEVKVIVEDLNEAKAKSKKTYHYSITRKSNSDNSQQRIITIETNETP